MHDVAAEQRDAAETAGQAAAHPGGRSGADEARLQHRVGEPQQMVAALTSHERAPPKSRWGRSPHPDPTNGHIGLTYSQETFQLGIEISQWYYRHPPCQWVGSAGL